MPYISLAHYKAGKNRANVPGEIEKIYRDGRVLKGTGKMLDNKLGKAVFKSLQNDIVQKSEDRIRISIGFLDTEHSHGDKYTFVRRSPEDKCPLCAEGVGDKIYKDGYLVHWALTRVPANPRTEIEVEKSMTTKREDAASIIQDEDVLEELELKSQTSDLIVTKSDDNDMDEMGECEEGDEECEKKKEDKEGAMQKSVATETVVIAAPVAPVFAPVPVTPAPVPSLEAASGFEQENNGFAVGSGTYLVLCGVLALYGMISESHKNPLKRLSGVLACFSGSSAFHGREW